MLSGLLRSPVAIQVNIQIMRAFVYMKNTLSAIAETTIRQDHLELEVEKLRNYVEDILRDQNDTNEMVGAQMEAINESLAELDELIKNFGEFKDYFVMLFGRGDENFTKFAVGFENGCNTKKSQLEIMINRYFQVG